MIRVLVIDDHPMVREGLRAMIGGIPDAEFAGECDGTGDLPALVAGTEANLVLIDYQLPRVSGDQLVKLLKESSPHVHVLGMSARPEAARPTMLAAGADGFLDKTDVGQFAAMVRQFVAGGTELPAE